MASIILQKNEIRNVPNIYLFFGPPPPQVTARNGEEAIAAGVFNSWPHYIHIQEIDHAE